MSATATMDAMFTAEPFQKSFKSRCRRFSQSRGLEYDEIVSEGQEHFVDAFYRYNSERSGKKGTAEGYALFYIHMMLLEKARTTAQRHARNPPQNMEMDELATMPAPRFDAEELFTQLSHEAALIVKLILTTPKEISKAIDAKGGRWNKPTVQSVLRGYLLGLGWSSKQITDSFIEIANAIS